MAYEALPRIGELYAAEADNRWRQPEERHRVRNERNRPLPESLKQRLEETWVKLSKKSETAEVVRYTLGPCEAGDGRLETDNNAADRALRAVALGRRN